jgi:hypothetical protein
MRHYSEAMNLIGKKRDSNCAGTVLYFSGLSDVLEHVDCDIAYSIIVDKCQKISGVNLKIGDILTDISHYVIYIGNGLCFEQSGYHNEFCVKKMLNVSCYLFIFRPSLVNSYI